jgi:S1-C subfamily serine protease
MSTTEEGPRASGLGPPEKEEAAPEKAAEAAAPEKIEVAATAANEAVPMPVEPALAEAVVAPVEVAKTAPVESTREAPSPEARGPRPEAPATPDAPVSTDDFQLGYESPPLTPMPPVLPTPAEAALQAAQIVSQMVDIDSESGAMIAATAAAGAAITAAVAAHKADLPSSDPLASHDPVSTVKLSRERILRALEQEPEPTAKHPSPRESRPAIEGGPQQPRATTADDGAYEEIDPVAIAAAAIARLRARARTDLAELRVHYHRHDIAVLVAAFVIMFLAGRLHTRLVTPPNVAFPSDHGLTFEHAAGWLGPEPVPLPSPRLVRESGGGGSRDESLYHVELSGTGTAKIEVLIDKKPAWSNIVTGLELDRRTRWGELYALDDSKVVPIAGHDWLRTAYHYAHADKGDVPRIDRALEYATIDRDQIYVITLFGAPGELDRIEDVVAPSLRVQSQTGLPLVPQTSRVSQHTYPGGVERAFGSTVMIVVADLIDGRLRARGGGSGVIVGADGSILTNYHVIHDKDGRLHDVFIIGRFSSPDRAPQLQCAGRPNRSKLQRDLDLALIKCDMDLDGRTWSPGSSGVWPTLPDAHAADVKMGQRLWVLGYPDVGGGGLTLSEGEVEGWTGIDGTAGKDFIKTDASITHGNSGGPVVDDQGRLVGIASAFRTKVTASGSVIETAQIGLVRPLGTASCLLDVASAGWTPREGHTDCDLAPTGVEAAAEGVRISTTVVDNANETPVRDALVMVLKPGVSSGAIDMNRLDDQTIAWGKTNAQGEVRLKQPVPIPGTYTVMVVAPGYEPLIGENELHLDAKTPPSFDPWGKIWLRAR